MPTKYKKPSIARLFKRTKYRLPMIGDPRMQARSWAKHTELIYDATMHAKEAHEAHRDEQRKCA
jgi:hypothetical protein